MVTFKQKIIIAYILIFLLFVALMFPFATKSARAIMYSAMQDRIDELVEALQSADNEKGLIALLKEQKPLIFYRVTLLDNEGYVLYDSHTKRLLATTPLKDKPTNHKEVIEAMEKGIGYHEEYSKLLNQEFAYMAKVFDFHGTPYIVRISFPLRYVQQITTNFRLGFVVLSSLVLLLFGLMTWFVINHLTKPIQKIIGAITPYQEGKSSFIPEIALPVGTHEFKQLASTLNSLTKRIQQQIGTLINERKEREIVLDSLAEGVVAVDNFFEITYTNSQAVQFYKKRGMKGLEEDTEAKNLLQKCQEEGAPISELIELYIDNKKSFYYLIAVPIKGHHGAVLVIQDTTPQLQIAEMRRDFVANASHELRTPITIIQGFAETLQEPELLLPDQIKKITTKIVNNCERMTRLIKELLLLADIERLPDSKLEYCDLLQLAKKCQATALEMHQDSKVTIDYDPGQTYEVIGAPDLIERALFNLIDNGLKYSKEVKEVNISLTPHKDSVQIDVKDRGIGMKPEDLERIFQRFYRSSEVRSGQIRGSGLGLSIVETIIAKHRGKITVSSKLGEGSQFTITLPRE